MDGIWADRDEVRWGKCIYCGKFYRNFTGDVCRECNRAIERETRALMRGVQRSQDYTLAWEVVADPLGEEGGFAPGTQLSDLDRKTMLHLGSFTPGTIIRKGVAHYKIWGPAGGAQAMEAVEVADETVAM